MLNTTIGEILPRSASAYGDKTALVFNDRSFSFAELDTMTNRMASGLASLGIEPGDRVTLYAQNSWEWVVSYHAIAKTGAVINPVNVMLTPDEVGYVVKDCGAKALITTPDRGEPILGLKDATTLSDIILFGDQALPGTRSFEEILSGGAEDLTTPAVRPEELSTICYTSGTTGFPKGAMLSHRNVVANAAITAAMNIRTDRDVSLTPLPCAHVYGATVMNACALFGMTFVLIERFTEIEMLDAIQRHRVTITDGVPTMYMLMLAHPDFDSYDLASLTRSVVGGQPMPAAKSQEWEDRTGVPLLELWGMTELAGPGLMQHAYADNRHGSVGLPMAYLEARIADPNDAATTLPPDEVGELMVKGHFVMMGYYGNEAATAETIEPDGWLHSGDLAKIDADGYIHIVDRKKDMILTGGYNVYPAEIERVIAGHPAVALVAVGSKPDGQKGEIAKAYIVLKPGAEASDADIIAFCRQHLAAYKLPREVQFVDDVPKTSTGKIMRRELSQLDEPPAAKASVGE